MNLHTAELKTRIKRFLDRKQMPRRLEGKETAQTDEIGALVRAISGYAPRENLTAWWDVFEAELGAACGPMWPTEKEARDAAQAAGRATVQPTDRDAPAVDALRTVAAQMAEGKPVAEGWLWGRNACDLIAAKLVDQGTMNRYRSVAFHSRKALYGETAALAWEAEAKARHQSARDGYRQTPAPVALPEINPNRTTEDTAA
jgi:hypothetical protein